MTTDRDLLQRYAQHASEDAFAEIVRRHVGLVYGTALRQLCGNTALAEDVTQAVFTALAAKRDSHPHLHHLAGWLYGTTRHTASHLVRAERRRQDREQKAHTMHTLLAESGPDDLAALPPALLDEVLERLDAVDREAVLRRFFEDESFATIGAALAVSEDAARMRVTRALEKIRDHFAHRGIRSSVAAIGAALAGQVVAAPPHLVAGIFAGCAALAVPAAAPLGALTLMTTTKLTYALAGTVTALALGVAGFQGYLASLHAEEAAQLSAEKSRLESALTASERQAALLARQSADAEQRAALLQRQLHATPAAVMPRATSSPPPPAVDETRRLRNEKMARLKPLLEAGQPIKGAVVVLVGGKAVPRPVEFVMGRDTRVEGVDDGTYVVKPSLKPDGSVQYEIALYRKDPATGAESAISVPRVIQTPWAPFTVTTGGGRVFAFDPDPIEP